MSCPIEESAEFITWGLFDLQPQEVEIAAVREATWGTPTKYELRGETLSANLSQIGAKLRECLRYEF